jgi:hypothetical protein
MLPEEQRTPEAHSIIVEQDDKCLHIPMTLRGVISGFEVRKPTREEMLGTEGRICTHVQMTSEMEWDPHSGDLSRLEEVLWSAVNNDYEVREARNREIYHLQVRRQQVSESEAEPEPESESKLEELKREVAAVTRKE